MHAGPVQGLFFLNGRSNWITPTVYYMTRYGSRARVPCETIKGFARENASLLQMIRLVPLKDAKLPHEACSSASS